MTETVPYLPGMSLGRTFDMRSLTIGQDIFTTQSTSNPQSIQSAITYFRCKAIKTSADVKDLLDISGELSLKIKAGLLKIDGMGSYLKEDRADEKTVEILMRAHIETVTESLTSSVPVSDWKRNQIGTHYIRSITYGGDLIANICIVGNDSTNLADIKAKVDADLKFVCIPIAQGKADFKKLKQDLGNRYEINLTYYSTTLETTVPRDIDGMFKALEDLPNQIVKLNGGKGVPIRCELVPLTQLDPDVPKFIRQKCLMNRLETLENQYDDVRQAKVILQHFLERIDVDLNTDQETKAQDMEDRINIVLNHSNDVISHLDVTSGGDSDGHIKDAFEVYKKNKKCGGFRKEVRRFIEQHAPHKLENASSTPKLLNILLCGQSGTGKCAESIFGERLASCISWRSDTDKCHLKSGDVGGRKIYLVDTLEIVNTPELSLPLQVIGTAIAHCPQGFHAFLLVLHSSRWRTYEDKMSITAVKKLFGKDVLKYTVLIFTCEDMLLFNEDDEYIRRLRILEKHGDDMWTLVENCNSRCVIINNKEKDPECLRMQDIKIISLIDSLVKENLGKMYTNDLFEFAQKKLKEERDKIKETEEQIKKRQQKLETEGMQQREKIKQLKEEQKKIEEAKKNIEKNVGKAVAHHANEILKKKFSA